MTLYTWLPHMFSYSLYLSTMAPVIMHYRTLRYTTIPLLFLYDIFSLLCSCPLGLCSAAIMQHQSGKKEIRHCPFEVCFTVCKFPICVLHSSLIPSALSGPIYVGFSSLIYIRNHQRVSERVSQ